MKRTKPKRIPIKAARLVGGEYGYDQVIITAWHRDTMLSTVITSGRTLQDAHEAAAGGNMIKKLLGWPDKECHAVPKRTK